MSAPDELDALMREWPISFSRPGIGGVEARACVLIGDTYTWVFAVADDELSAARKLARRLEREAVK